MTQISQPFTLVNGVIERESSVEHKPYGGIIEDNSLDQNDASIQSEEQTPEAKTELSETQSELNPEPEHADLNQNTQVVHAEEENRELLESAEEEAIQDTQQELGSKESDIIPEEETTTEEQLQDQDQEEISSEQPSGESTQIQPTQEYHVEDDREEIASATIVPESSTFESEPNSEPVAIHTEDITQAVKQDKSNNTVEFSQETQTEPAVTDEKQVTPSIVATSPIEGSESSDASSEIDINPKSLEEVPEIEITALTPEKNSQNTSETILENSPEEGDSQKDLLEEGYVSNVDESAHDDTESHAEIVNNVENPTQGETEPLEEVVDELTSESETEVKSNDSNTSNSEDSETTKNNQEEKLSETSTQNPLPDSTPNMESLTLQDEQKVEPPQAQDPLESMKEKKINERSGDNKENSPENAELKVNSERKTFKDQINKDNTNKQSDKDGKESKSIKGNNKKSSKENEVKEKESTIATQSEKVDQPKKIATSKKEKKSLDTQPKSQKIVSDDLPMGENQPVKESSETNSKLGKDGKNIGKLVSKASGKPAEKQTADAPTDTSADPSKAAAEGKTTTKAKHSRQNIAKSQLDTSPNKSSGKSLIISSPPPRRYSDVSDFSTPKHGSTSSSKSPFVSRREMTEEERLSLEKSLKEFHENRRQEKERKRKRQAALIKQRQKELEMELEAQRLREEEMRQKEEERKQQIREKYERKIKEIEERKRERERILVGKDSTNKSVPLYKRMEKQFEKEILKSEQEKINDLLMKKHEIFQKPTEEFATLDTEYLRMKRQREEERRRQKELWLNNLKSNNNKNLYHGKAAEIVMEEFARAKVQELEQKKRRQELLQKQKGYAKELQEKFKPKVDKKLRQEIEERNVKKSLKLPNIKDEAQPEESVQVKKDGPRVETYNHRYIQSLPKEMRRKSLEPIQEEEKHPSPEKIRKLGNDYLAEVKQYVRQHKKVTSSPGKSRDLDHLKYKAFKLDSKAARKEKYLQDEPKNAKQFKKQLEASKAIVDAVKMKLELLTELETEA